MLVSLLCRRCADTNNRIGKRKIRSTKNITPPTTDPPTATATALTVEAHMVLALAQLWAACTLAVPMEGAHTVAALTDIRSIIRRGSIEAKAVVAGVQAAARATLIRFVRL